MAARLMLLLVFFYIGCISAVQSGTDGHVGHQANRVDVSTQHKDKDVAAHPLVPGIPDIGTDSGNNFGDDSRGEGGESPATTTAKPGCCNQLIVTIFGDSQKLVKDDEPTGERARYTTDDGRYSLAYDDGVWAVKEKVDDKGWIKIVAHVTDDRRCPNEIDSSWTWRKHEGTSSIDYDAGDNLAVSCEGETGCCDDVKVTIHDNEINFQKGYELVNGRAYYTSEDTKWVICYCDEEGGKWEIREKIKQSCSDEGYASMYDDSECPITAESSWERFDDDTGEYSDLGDNITLSCMEEEKITESLDNGLPVVVVLGASGVGKSTFCNYLSGFREDDPFGYKSGIPVDESSVTKSAVRKTVQWLGTGPEFVLIDTPGLADPGGSSADREQFKEVIRLLKSEIKDIHVLIHVVKGTDTRKLPYLQQNLKILKFMFGDPLKENMVNQVTFWSHYEYSEEDRENFRHRRNFKQAQLFDDKNLTIKTFFIDPVDALPQDLRKTKLDLYSKKKGSWATQEEEVENLKEFIWNQPPFSCQDTCDYAQGLFETRKPYPTIKSGDQYGATQTYAGKKLEIDCLVASLFINSVKQKRISWWHNETRIKTRKRDDIAVTGGIADEFLYKATLTIVDTNVSHAGTYSCGYRREKARLGLRVDVMQPVNCKWSDFGEWSQCSKTCGDGWRFRSRHVLEQAQNRGEPCHGGAMEFGDCKAEDCPGDCMWSDWLPWTRCDESCGTGEQRRSRTEVVEAVNGGQNCTGETEQARRCNTQSCPVPCTWGRWSSFSRCQGNGECGMGMKKRSRQRNGPRHGGFDCVGNSEDYQMCSLGMCGGGAAARVLPALILLSVILSWARLYITG